MLRGPEPDQAAALGPDQASGPHAAAEHAHQRITRQLLFWARASFILVGSLPWWLPLARRFLPVAPLWQVLDWFFLPVCHRLPARTLMLAGVAMPVCSRCAGIFAGLALGAILAWPKLSLRVSRAAIGLAGIIMALDVLAQDLGWHPFWHWTRLLTGTLLGYLLTCTLVAAIVREQRDGAPRVARD